jgi:Dyp-type peroxidase family
MTPRLDVAEIQGNVLRGYGLPFGCHLFVHVDETRAGRAWLEGVAARVTSAELQARARPRVAHNVAVSAAGLEALGVPKPLVARFAPEFQKGMKSRATEHLGDDGESHPDRWEEAFVDDDRRVHVLVSVHADSEELLASAVERLRHELAQPGLTEVHSRPFHRLPRGKEHFAREHFGFADGFAQPSIAGAPPEMRPGPAGFSWRRPLPPGEFLLGYRDLEGVLPAGPSGPLGRNGTYMVYRELDQDVLAFRRFLVHQADLHGISAEVVAAKIMGRWRDGTPLVVSPFGPDPNIAKVRSDPRLDDFAYAEADPHGFRCPIGAHIRRTHPRDALGFGVQLSRRHRMIRRGMPYGPPLSDDAVEEEAKEGEKKKGYRGLAFACFVGSIERQFEFVQRQWCNDGNAFGLGADADLIIGQGQGRGKMTLQGWPPRLLNPLPAFVTTVGGEYLFVPGLDGLAALVRGATRS